MTTKFILSKSKVLEQYNKVKAIADIVSYSSKTNPIVTKILEQTDSWFSIHLKNELKNINDKSRILFLAQAWNEKDIEELLRLGINRFVVDNEPDLDTLLNHLKNKEDKITLFLRLKLKEHSIRTEKYFVFGMQADIINKRIKELKDNQDIEKLGIHFHLRTQNLSEWNYQPEIEHSIKHLEMIDYINIGGGLPSEYANTNVEVINSIFNKINELRVWLNKKNISLILEPGRFISAPAVKLVTEIIGIYDNNIIINASVYNSDMDALIVPVKLLVENEVGKEESQPYVIKGITPCSLDIFRYRVYLKNPKIGDQIVFLNAGAYNFHTEFCDLDKIPTEVVI